MNEIWLSIKAWTQRLIIAALVIYAGLFFSNNRETVTLWYWFKHDHQTTVFLLAGSAFIVGVIFAILMSTALKTLKQIRDLRSRSRHEKMERDLEDMKAKAAMLQTRAAGSGGQVDETGRAGGA
jgi:lysylphosphatidylglycerol synthetase-like protein (DUF2156 family)